MMVMVAPISGTLGTELRPGPRSLGTRAAPILHQSRFRRKRVNQRKFGALKHRCENRLGPSHLVDDWLQVAAGLRLWVQTTTLLAPVLARYCRRTGSMCFAVLQVSASLQSAMMRERSRSQSPSWPT